MTKNQYRFNPETVKFEKINHNYKRKILGIMGIFVTATIGGFLLFLFFAMFYDTPKERMLKMENADLQTSYKRLEEKVKTINKVVESMEKRDDNLYRFLLDADPLPTELRNSGIGGVNRYQDYEDLPNAKIAKRLAKRIDNLMKKTYIQTKSLDELDSLAQQKQLMLASVPSIIPIRREFLRSRPSGFRMRFHPIHKIWRMHWGMDFSLPSGSEIYASGDGVVLKTNRGRGYGIHVVIKHNYGGYETLYAHMKKTAVKPGQKVKRGEIIGYVGNTGISTAPHLHYEVHKNGRKLNPINYYFNDLTPEEYNDLVLDANNPIQTLD